MWSHQRCREIIKRYKDKVKTVSKRKRGNPPDVIKAMEILAGGKQCVMCGDMNTHLHHANGNWRDYSPSNLIFVCKQHHLQLHKELKENVMMTKKTKETVYQLRRDVDGLIAKGQTKKDAIEEIALCYGIRPTTAEKMYYGYGSYRDGQSTNITNNKKIVTVTVTLDHSALPLLIEHVPIRNISFNI